MRKLILYLFLVASKQLSSQGTYNDFGFVSNTEIILNYSSSVLANKKVREIYFWTIVDSARGITTKGTHGDTTWYGLDKQGILKYRKRGIYLLHPPYPSNPIIWDNHFIGYDTIHLNKTKKGLCKHVDSLVFDSASYKDEEINALYWKETVFEERTLNTFDKKGRLIKQLAIHNGPTDYHERKYYYKKSLYKTISSFYNSRVRYISDSAALLINGFEEISMAKYYFQKDGQLSSIEYYSLDYDTNVYKIRETERLVYKSGLLNKIIFIDEKAGKEENYVIFIGYNYQNK